MSKVCYGPSWAYEFNGMESNCHIFLPNIPWGHCQNTDTGELGHWSNPPGILQLFRACFMSSTDIDANLHL